MPQKKSKQEQQQAAENAETEALNQTLKKTQILNTQQSLQKYLNLYQQLKAENEQLRRQLREYSEDHVQVSGFLQTDVEQRTNTINKLQQEVFEQKRRADDQIAELQQELKANEKKYQTELERRDDIIKDQEQTLLQFERVKRERQILEDVLQQKEKEILEIRKSYDNKITLLQLQFVEQKVKLQEEGEQLKKSLEDNLNQRAMEMLGVKSQEIHQENQKLQKHQDRIQKDLTMVAQLKQEALSKSVILERDNDLKNDTIRSQAKRGMQLAREVKELRSKVKNLQETLTKVVNKNLEDKKVGDELHESELSNMKQELEEVKTLLKVRTTELVNLKKLAKRVVSNRSELEKFFMEALSQVKRAKEAENGGATATMRSGGTKFNHSSRRRRFSRGNNSRKTTQASSHLPPLGASGLNTARSMASRMSDTSSDYQPSGDDSFEYLSWDDKEKVIKLLFKKINGVGGYSGAGMDTGRTSLQGDDGTLRRTTTPASAVSMNSGGRFFVTEGATTSNGGMSAGSSRAGGGRDFYSLGGTPTSPQSQSFGLKYST